jgi:pimeloyl-ACP methyl ester carboxylesterase
MPWSTDTSRAHAAVEPVSQKQRIAFTFALTVGSRVIHLRDMALGRIPRRQMQIPGITFTPLSFSSGSNRLDAVCATPDSEPTRAAVLICHGIGEVVSQWAPIQCLFAARGVASLVFDYSGYGRSTGRPSPAQFESDALAAFAQFCALTPCPVSLLGFSLGTGIATAILDRVRAHRLVLCAPYTSFRAASRRVGIPTFLFPLVPPVWDSTHALRSANHRVLIVHSTRDRLFPVTMARDLASSCGPRADLHIVEGLGHNQPFYKPTRAYWDPIANFLIS